LGLGAKRNTGLECCRAIGSSASPFGVGRFRQRTSRALPNGLECFSCREHHQELGLAVGPVDERYWFP
jgi:hypothetical protein